MPRLSVVPIAAGSGFISMVGRWNESATFEGSEAEVEARLPRMIATATLIIAAANGGVVGEPGDQVVVIAEGAILRKVEGSELAALYRSIMEASTTAVARWRAATG